MNSFVVWFGMSIVILVAGVIYLLLNKLTQVQVPGSGEINGMYLPPKVVGMEDGKPVVEYNELEMSRYLYPDAHLEDRIDQRLEEVSFYRPQIRVQPTDEYIQGTTLYALVAKAYEDKYKREPLFVDTSYTPDMMRRDIGNGVLEVEDMD